MTPFSGPIMIQKLVVWVSHSEPQNMGQEGCNGQAKDDSKLFRVKAGQGCPDLPLMSWQMPEPLLMQRSDLPQKMSRW